MRNGLALTLVLSSMACGSGKTLKAMKAVRTSVESSVTTTTSGTVVADQQAILNFGNTGRISKVYVRVGDQVKRGKTLAEIDNEELKTVHEDAKSELKRAEELFKSGLTSRSTLDEAKKNEELARANLDRSVIRAPFDGIIAELNLEQGESTQPTVSAKTPPIRIVDLKPRLVKGDIDELDLSKVKVGSRARIKVQAVRLDPFSAEVQRVVPFVSTVKEQDRTSEVELKILDGKPEEIPVGASAEIEIITASKDNALAVPPRVILGHGGERYIYIHDGRRLQKRLIKTGVGNYARVEIVSGVSDGETVLYPPEDLELKDGMKTSVEISPWP